MDHRTPALKIGCLAALSALLLCGFSFGEVKLRVDKPLIDLSETVRLSAVGDADTLLAGEDGAQERESYTDADGRTAQADGALAEEVQEEAPPAPFAVRVTEDRIYLDSVRYVSAQAVVNRIAARTGERETAGTGSRTVADPGSPAIVLIDDYAEYHTYREVREALLAAGFSFTEEVGE